MGLMSKKLPTITRRAAEAIIQIVEKYSPADKKNHYLPIIGWMVESNQPGFVVGPCLALELESKVPDEFILRAHNISVGFNIPEAKLKANEDAVLDFMEGRFVFVPKAITRFID